MLIACGEAARVQKLTDEAFYMVDAVFESLVPKKLAEFVAESEIVSEREALRLKKINEGGNAPPSSTPGGPTGAASKTPTGSTNKSEGDLRSIVINC